MRYALAVDEGVAGPGDWSPLRSAAAVADYTHLRLGPLALGPPRWRSSVGHAHLALAEAHEEIVVVDRITAVQKHPSVDPSDLMSDVRHVLGLEHRHVMRIVGAGIDSEIPYVVRRFRLGRPLDEVLDAGPMTRSLAVALMYPIAEALAFLADAGAAPGLCSVGGFDLRDVWVGFDGGVWVTGHGTRRLRVDEDTDPVERDFASLRRLATLIGRAASTDLRALLDDLQDLEDALVALRRADRDACGLRTEFIGAWMRTHFDNAIRTERARFGLDTLH